MRVYRGREVMMSSKPRFKKLDMITINLTITEAKEFRTILESVANRIQGKAVGQARTTTPSEELQVNACAECWKQITTQLQNVTVEEMAKEQSEFIEEYQDIIDRQATEN